MAAADVCSGLVNMANVGCEDTVSVHFVPKTPELVAELARIKLTGDD